MKTILYLVGIIISALALPASAQYTSWHATFIPAASPVATRRNANAEALSFARSQMISGGYGLYPPTTTSTTMTTSKNTAAAASTSTQLFAKKKKVAPAAAKKIQVKMLKHVAGTGQAGEVVLVTPAFFNNKLRPQQAARMITDEEVAEETAEKQMKEDADRTKANELKETLDELELKLVRTAGPDGQLFGGVGPKVVMSELQSEIADDFLNNKWVKVTEVMDENGKKMRGDIKTVGEFGARINLLSGISAKIGIKVEAE
ncbi:unnamed protein product [Cylindrotheca closterium]|uniref:50S ribosomal protein L9, chloroplastic n=1 Tax=Cylindrotheca closterium TaxID=2856 RepID=A0AAD2CFV2_9STRA|nr:unnamed protein product [Cylindrotheca closterium]